MDIHKPKPWHGAREFLKEYVIIVVGVLTALAGEQVVERIHVGSEVKEAREALNAELASNSRTASFTQVEVGCLDEELEGLEAWAKGGPRPRPMQANFPYLASSTWDMVKSGAVPHMPLKERLAYSRYYGAIDNYRWAIENSRGVFLNIQGEAQPVALSTAQATALLAEVSRARVTNRVRSSNAAAIAEMASGLGVKPNPLTDDDRSRLSRICGRPFDG